MYIDLQKRLIHMAIFSTFFSDLFSDDKMDNLIVSRKDWLAMDEKQAPMKLAANPPPYVVIHHTGTPACEDDADCIRSVRKIQRREMSELNLTDVSYNFFVATNGKIYEGRGWQVAGRHTLNFNDKSIGIGLIGDFDRDDPTKEQIETTVKLLQAGVAREKLAKNYKLLGAKQVTQTDSPGDKLYEIIRNWEHWVLSDV